MTHQFVTVTKEAFFAHVGPRNIHPRSERDFSLWIDQSTNAVVGKSTPGYANGWTAQGAAPSVYMLTPDRAEVAS